MTCRDHQRAHWSKHKSSCSPFTLRNSKTRGRHLVASRAIARGEVILEVWVLLLKMRVLKFSLFRSPQSLQARSSTQPLFVLVAIVRLPYLGPGFYLGSPIHRDKYILDSLNKIVLFCRCSKCDWPVCGVQCEERPIHRAECKVSFFNHQ